VGGGAGTDAMTCDGFRIPEDHPNAARDYDTSIPEVVSDAVTGLMWERSVTGSDAHWNGAAAYCPTKTMAGFSGWRLPRLLELESIVDFAVYDPAIDVTSFPSTPPTWFATSTGVYVDGRLEGGLDYGWTTDFNTGLTSNGKPTYGFVRCVRTAAPLLCHPAGARFQPSPSEVVVSVVDGTTGLTWQKGSSPDAVNWEDAKKYCASVGGGFRLPGAKELLSLFDTMTTGVAIDKTAFPGTPADGFWTSSSVAGTPASALIIDFSSAVSAGTNAAGKTDLHHVRCVRSP
jgi:hypothetical protein